MLQRTRRIAVVGLGYVGLPLAVAFSKHVPVIGFDIQSTKIDELRRGHDRTGSVSSVSLKTTRITFTTNPYDLKAADIIIVAVPTPINEALQPDLTALKQASMLVGQHLSPGTIVVYESTVYPGATEEVCLPILEQTSGLRCGEQFYLGYSPERINPGDHAHTLETIVKVVSAHDPETLDVLADTYSLVVTAGIHRAPSIKVAEAAKVIENTQRDLNIALMNELALIFHRLNIDTHAVLEAAGTKWNFLPFTPGLVGGHCIGVDPYYLTTKAESVGYHPQVILAGRRINTSMGPFIGQQTVKLLSQLDRPLRTLRVGILGLTFKENVPDLRNSRVPDILQELRAYGIDPLVHDAYADPRDAHREYGLTLIHWDDLVNVDAIILAVPHEMYRVFGLPALIQKFTTPHHGILIDVKGLFAHETRPESLRYWKL